ncbi:unnamed protein product, partial [Ectocarpus sp. 13 AM-2016]
MDTISMPLPNGRPSREGKKHPPLLLLLLETNCYKYPPVVTDRSHQKSTAHLSACTGCMRAPPAPHVNRPVKNGRLGAGSPRSHKLDGTLNILFVFAPSIWAPVYTFWSACGLRTRRGYPPTRSKNAWTKRHRREQSSLGTPHAHKHRLILRFLV